MDINTPIEEKTVRDFKVGDKVKVEFEGVVTKDFGFQFDVKANGVSYPVHKENLTLLESAKPKLEVGDEFSLMPGRIRIKYVSEKFVVARYLTGQKCEFGKERKDFEKFLERELITEGE